MDEKEVFAGLKDSDAKQKKKGKQNYSLKNEIIKLILIILIMVFASLAAYYFYFYTRTCYDAECFSVNMVNCKRAEWINDDAEASWLYTIKGKQKRECEVNVKLLMAKKGKIELINIEGESMVCFLPLGTLASPEQNLEMCHGLLKEELQDLIIKKMHSYILENLGEINEEIKNLTNPV